MKKILMSLQSKYIAFTTAQQETWRNRIRNELFSPKQWYDMWGFLLEETTVGLKDTPSKENNIANHENSEQIRLRKKVRYVLSVS